MENSYTKIEINNQIFYLIGTAHVSKVSSIQVENVIDEVIPDAICIELDQKRYDNLNNPKKWEDANVIDIIKSKQVVLLLINTILASYQKRVAENLDSTSGQEMIVGIKKAKELKAKLVLADRNIQTTFMRIWRKHTFFQKIKLMSSIFFSIFEDEKISEEDIENLKQSDILEAALNDVGKNFPVIKEVLVDERDIYLASKIRSAKGEKVVAILGAAHMPGVIKHLANPVNISELDKIPPKSFFSKISGYIIPALIICAIIFTSYANLDLGLEQIKSWLLWNGTLSAIGVLLAKGHILSIITAFIVAPFTSLNPLLAAGWFAGIVEAMVKKPKVKDFENLSNSLNSFKEFRSNSVMRILLIVILANVFSTIATIISGLDIFNIFLNTI